MVLIKVREGASQAAAEGMLEAFNSLPQQIDSSVIVQLTAGENAWQASLWLAFSWFLELMAFLTPLDVHLWINGFNSVTSL